MKVIVVCVVVALAVIVHGQTTSRGRVKWPGIRLGDAIVASDILNEFTPIDDLTEENLLRALSVSPEGSGSGSSEEFEKVDVKKTRTNRNATYHFLSRVNDGIKGGHLQREETRKGQQVKGSYSYSDGFVTRTVDYVADENGYRVIREIFRRIGNGPKENTEGIANVQAESNGRRHRYSVKGADLNAGRTFGLRNTQ